MNTNIDHLSTIRLDSLVTSLVDPSTADEVPSTSMSVMGAHFSTWSDIATDWST